MREGGSGARPTGGRWRAIAPGRVNLIGEHTDYNGLPVFPIAIDRDVRIDFTVVDDPVVRLGTPSPRFAPFTFQLKRPIEAAAQGDWSNYARAAARGLLEHGIALERGIEGSVTGDIPIASGLSSSSALVVASALALLKANGVEVEDASEEAVRSEARSGGPAGEEDATTSSSGRDRDQDRGPRISRLELATLMARAERFVGLDGGGMDQAACLHGREGHALRIAFDPLRVTPVPVPEGWRWVVASSLTRAEKSAGARDAYNERARQCREALELMGASAYQDLVAVDDPDGLLLRARHTLSPVLFRRFRHVVTEGRRVARAERAMRAGDLRRFGDLMLRSHKSLCDDYEVSTAELDAIVTVALEAGAAGVRLTGAGFGGCAVALCDDTTVAPVMEALTARFYQLLLGRPPTSDVMFAAKPSGGARVEGLGDQE